MTNELESLRADYASLAQVTDDTYNAIWAIVGDGADWDYPAQITRAVQSMKERAEKLEAENARLRATLEWYANTDNHVSPSRGSDPAIISDFGERAQQALEREG